jgi:uncharacterized protein (TIGR04255 family)
MAINEIFNNPTVKTVIFQIQYPNLFYIEKIIGDYQVKIMERFPQSSLILQKGLFITLGSQGQIPSEGEDENSTKIWQFSSENDAKLSIQTTSLAIVSTHHKTYNMGDGDKFRDLIKFSLDHFFSFLGIPIINRIGLRYIDHCPIINKDNQTYLQFYNTCFPLNRFSLKDANVMDFKTTVKRGDYLLTYRETAQTKDNEFMLVLDFDGAAQKVKPENYLSVTDDLHKLISDEFDLTAKEALKEYMRQ